MKKFLYGLAAGLAAGALAQSIAGKNQEKLLELVKNLPSTLSLSPDATLDELKVHKARLEDLIKEKSAELGKLSKEKTEELRLYGKEKVAELKNKKDQA